MTVKITIEVSDSGELKLNESKPESKSKSSKADELSVKLMTRDDLEPEDEIKLELDVLAFVKKELKAGNMKCIKEFLKDNKFTPELKEKLRDLILEFKENK